MGKMEWREDRMTLVNRRGMYRMRMLRGTRRSGDGQDGLRRRRVIREGE